MGENKNVIFVVKRQNRPSRIRFTWIPPPFTISKNSKNIERTLFTPYNAYKNQQQKNTKGKIDPHKYVLQGSPLNKNKKKRQNPVPL